MFFEEGLYKKVGERLLAAEPMSRHTTFRIGGPADWYVAPYDEAELASVISLCREAGIPFLILGNGSNLLCGDGGFRGVVIDMTKHFTHCVCEEDTIRAGAGLLLGSLARQAMQAGLTGLEFAAGIPGSVGGALVMNAGAYGGEMAQVTTWVRVLTPEGEFRRIPAEELDFAYRHSVIPGAGYIVVEAEFQLEPGKPDQIRARIEELAARRRAKQPLEYPSAGSTFKRPAGHFAAQLIDEAGLKGFSVGGARVSEKHAGFVINDGNATANDVLTLCSQIRQQILRTTGVELELEVALVGEFT